MAGSDVRLTARETAGVPRHAEAAACGLPFPRGEVQEATDLRLLDAAGAPVPLQATALDRWPDGTVRWALLEFPASVDAGGTVELRVHRDQTSPPVAPEPPLAVRRTEDGVFVDTGTAQFLIARHGTLPFRTVRAGGVEVLDPARSGWDCIDAEGHVWSPAVRRLEVEAEGPLAARVLVTGVLDRPDRRPLLDFEARLHFRAGTAAVRLALTVRNPRRALHPGGHWELGDAGSILLRDLSLRFAAMGAGRVSWSVATESPLAEAAAGSVEIHQDSSGGENWDSRNHLTRERALAVSFRGYRLRVDGAERTGQRATPRVAVHDGSSGVSAALEHFWQNFPKALEGEDGVLTVRLFPRQCAHLHELQGGEQKTHDILLAFGAEATDPRRDGDRCPLVFHADPRWYADSGAVPYLIPWADDPSDLYRELTHLAVDGDDTFHTKRERVDEYGWRHFGELWADHEANLHEGDDVFLSHYNNQYDVVYGAFLQFLRSGDLRWHAIMRELARHVIDIDIYHTREDKPAYNQGLFWHTVHYVDADLATHRTYPRRGSQGGGPDDEHNYTTGLMHYWLLTGDPLGRETALGSADWVIDADDGGGTVLRWLDRGPTGLATKTRDFDYHGPGRGAGNSINALLDGWRLTGETKYLDKCDEVIRRTVHPADDLAARRLLDAENRWSYTVYLQALGKYLDVAVEDGRLDGTYAYVRESLLAYARWMAEHERLILERPDELDFPTETWSAQDVRKSEVLTFATLHAAGAERERFTERAAHFFGAALRQLADFPTRSYVRPVILLMHYGMMQAWLAANPEATRPAGPALPDPGEPARFVPQKLRALAKLKRLAAAGAAGVALIVILILIRSCS